MESGTQGAESGIKREESGVQGVESGIQRVHGLSYMGKEWNPKSKECMDYLT